MSKKFAVRLAVIILLTAINSCYLDREINEGLEICYLNGANQYLYTMNIDGSNKKQFIPNQDIYYPSWSPDGEKIVFTIYDSYFNIYIVNADGTNLKKITNSTSAAIGNHFPTWSSDGERILFTENRSGTNYIQIANTDGTILESFTTYVGLSVEGLSSSPDGKYIYYNGEGNLFKLDITTGVHTNLSINIEGDFSVSPDGKNIAYIYNTNIYIYNIDAGNTSTPITAGGSPCWTPDGKVIVYAESNNIFSINIDGTNQKPLTNIGTNSQPCVKWKPK